MGLEELKAERNRLVDYTFITFDPRVRAAMMLVREENAPKVAEIDARIKSLRDAKPAPKPRFPVDAPQAVLDACDKFWRGTTEHATYRIHLWNNKAVWTSYPAGGYSNAGGWNPTPPSYRLISFSETQYGKPKQLLDITPERNSGQRVTPKIMQAELDKL